MNYTIVSIAAAVVLYLLFKRPTPLKHSNLSRACVGQLVSALFRRGFDGGSLVLRAGDQSFTFTKRIVFIGDVRLDGLATMPSEIANELQMNKRLAELGLNHPARAGSGSPAVRTLEFEYGDELALALDSILIVAGEGWGVSLEQVGVATLHKVSERNESIGWKE